MTDDRDSDDVGALIDTAVERRWRAGWSTAACDRFAQVLTVPCPARPFGCGVRPGHECTNLATNPRGTDPAGLLGGLGFHVARGVAAGVSFGPPTTDEERRGPTRAPSVHTRAAQHYRTTGTDLPGYTRGRPNGGTQ